MERFGETPDEAKRVEKLERFSQAERAETLRKLEALPGDHVSDPKQSGTGKAATSDSGPKTDVPVLRREWSPPGETTDQSKPALRRDNSETLRRLDSATGSGPRPLTDASKAKMAATVSQALLSDVNSRRDQLSGREVGKGPTLLTPQERSETLRRVEAMSSDQTSDWKELGIRDVRVADLPKEHPGEWKKIPEDQMRAGLLRLQEMQREIRNGVGTNADYWHERDRKLGLEPKDSYAEVYHAFYGKDAIRIVDDGTESDVTNGKHRIWLAHEMGIDTLPASVVQRRR